MNSSEKGDFIHQLQLGPVSKLENLDGKSSQAFSDASNPPIFLTDSVLNICPDAIVKFSSTNRLVLSSDVKYRFSSMSNLRIFYRQ